MSLGNGHIPKAPRRQGHGEAPIARAAITGYQYTAIFMGAQGRQHATEGRNAHGRRGRDGEQRTIDSFRRHGQAVTYVIVPKQHRIDERQGRWPLVGAHPHHLAAPGVGRQGHLAAGHEPRGPPRKGRLHQAWKDVIGSRRHGDHRGFGPNLGHGAMRTVAPQNHKYGHPKILHG